MSYDVSLYVFDAKGKKHYLYDTNHTSNTARMWRDAGCDLAEFHGKTAAELARDLAPAVFTMRARPSHYEEMNPENGWGSYQSTLEFLSGILDMSERWPQAWVYISR